MIFSFCLSVDYRHGDSRQCRFGATAPSLRFDLAAETPERDLAIETSPYRATPPHDL
jgi:hypothetical protein